MGVEAEEIQLPLEMSAVVNTIKDPLMRKQMESFGKKIAEREKQEQEKRGPEAPKPGAKPVQFPLPFPSEARPASNDLIRSSLFAAVRGKHRQHFKDFVQIATIGDLEIWWQGHQLNQDDHDSFMQLVYMAQHKPLGEDVRVSFRGFLAGLGKKYGSNTRKAAEQSLMRLVTGSVKLVNKRAGLNYYGHLVHDGIVPSFQSHLPRLERDLVYHINPKLRPYFARSSFTLIDWRKRLALKENDLAKWLQLWINSNAKYYPTKVETIHEKCGSQAKNLYQFREQLREAMRNLEENGVIQEWRIEKGNDLLHVFTKPSPSQQKHRIKAKPRIRR